MGFVGGGVAVGGGVGGQVLVPTPRDALATCQILESAGLAGRTCHTLQEVCREAMKGAGAALLTAFLSCATGFLAWVVGFFAVF